MSHIQQIADGDVCRLFVADVDAGRVDIKGAVDDDHGDSLGVFPNKFDVFRGRNVQNTVYAQALKRFKIIFFPLCVALRVAQNNGIPGFHGQIFKRFDNLRIIGVDDVRNNQANQARTAGFEHLRRHVRLIIQFFNRLKHLLAGFGRNLRAAGHRSGYRAERYAAILGYIFDSSHVIFPRAIRLQRR